MRLLIIGLSSILLLSACSSGAGYRGETALYDLYSGNQQQSVMVKNPVMVGRVEVQAPSWLSSSAMQYRLVAESGRRRSFSESRWAAPPAELLEGNLRRYLVTAGTCRLRVELDEWVQAFDANGESQAHLVVRATLLTMRSADPLVSRRFELTQDAGRNAANGASAFSTLGHRLAVDVSHWLNDQGGISPRLSEVCGHGTTGQQPRG